MLFRIATPVALLAAAYVALAGSLAERQLWLMLCGVVFVGALLAWVGVSGELKSRRRPF